MKKSYIILSVLLLLSTPSYSLSLPSLFSESLDSITKKFSEVVKKHIPKSMMPGDVKDMLCREGKLQKLEFSARSWKGRLAEAPVLGSVLYGICKKYEDFDKSHFATKYLDKIGDMKPSSYLKKEIKSVGKKLKGAAKTTACLLQTFAPESMQPSLGTVCGE